jgi:hypothetical protein
MINFEKILITPAKAKEYLQANIENRNLREKHVSKLVNDIIENRWIEDTAETIKIAKSGRILDGQHRLHAIVKANKSIYCHVATGLDESVFKVIDTGTVRNATDVFKIEKIKHDKQLPSIIQFYNSLETGKKRKNVHVNEKSTNAMLLEQYYENEVFWQSVARNSFNWYISFAKIVAPSFIGGFYAHFYKLNNEKAYLFINQLATGLNVEHDVISLLRTKLMQDKMSIKKMPQFIKMALVIKAWNIYIQNISIKQLKFQSDFEPYPKAIGSVNELQYEDN